jgi:hypothetical protein
MLSGESPGAREKTRPGFSKFQAESICPLSSDQKSNAEDRPERTMPVR